MTKTQEEYSTQFFKDHPDIKKLFLNPEGEWFTDDDYAQNSLKKDKNGKVTGKIETVTRPETAEDDVEDTTDTTGHNGSENDDDKNTSKNTVTDSDTGKEEQTKFTQKWQT
ncbi:hypothetical protein [Chryseobacterium arthrosphaerae]|uniref:hypothetical protein n=1 Tax=Chryseobacterium arthrosphaerae TaxID=651561 RepID=UPI003D3403C4